MFVISQDVYREQQKIQERTAGRYPTDIHANHKERCLQLMVEAAEVLDLSDWKPHRTSGEPIDREKLKDELVDVYKF